MGEYLKEDFSDLFTGSMQKGAAALERNGYPVQGYCAYVPEHNSLRFTDKDRPEQALNQLFHELMEKTVTAYLSGNELVETLTQQPADTESHFLDMAYSLVRGELFVQLPDDYKNEYIYIDYIPSTDGGEFQVEAGREYEQEIEQDVQQVLSTIL